MIKNVNILIPDPGPLGDTFFEARVRAMVSGSLVNNPCGGNVDSVFTLPDHFPVALVMCFLCHTITSPYGNGLLLFLLQP